VRPEDGWDPGRVDHSHCQVQAGGQKGTWKCPCLWPCQMGLPRPCLGYSCPKPSVGGLRIWLSSLGRICVLVTTWDASKTWWTPALRLKAQAPQVTFQFLAPRTSQKTQQCLSGKDTLGSQAQQEQRQVPGPAQGDR
jgi:hypothetical protein